MPNHALSLVALSLSFLWSAQAQSDPWPRSDLIEPNALAEVIRSPAPPLVISVAFPVLYRNKHILHAINAGAASKPEGIAELKQLVAHTPASAQIVIYCGCCPMVKCPNVRPAYRALKDLGFQHVRVLNIPANMHTDWYYRNYPSEPGSASANDNR